jgi:hypothetical protein
MPLCAWYELPNLPVARGLLVVAAQRSLGMTYRVVALGKDEEVMPGTKDLSFQ